MTRNACAHALETLLKLVDATWHPEFTGQMVLAFLNHYLNFNLILYIALKTVPLIGSNEPYPNSKPTF